MDDSGVLSVRRGKKGIFYSETALRYFRMLHISLNTNNFYRALQDHIAVTTLVEPNMIPEVLIRR